MSNQSRDAAIEVRVDRNPAKSPIVIGGGEVIGAKKLKQKCLE